MFRPVTDHAVCLGVVLGAAVFAAGMLGGCSSSRDEGANLRSRPARSSGEVSRARHDARVLDDAANASAQPRTAASKFQSVQAGNPGLSQHAASAKPQAAASTSQPTAPAQLRERALAELLAIASADDPQARANALESLVWAPDRLVLVAPAALRDSSPGVRGVAALSLAKARVCSLWRDVTPMLSDESSLVRASAILSLWRCNRPVDPTPLAGMLKSQKPNERAHAAWVLGEMKETSALTMLSEAARDTLPRASIGQTRLMELQIAEARVKLSDNQALTEIRTALYPARNEDLEAAALAAQISGDVADHAFSNGLIALTAEQDENGNPMPAEVRLAAAAALAKLGQAHGDPIALHYINDPAPTIRMQAALVLGALRKREHLGQLERLLGDSSGQVRAAACGAILQILESGSVLRE